MDLRYIIVTPVYNEAAYIEKTIEAVLSQSVCPYLWIIVDDGSTDQTAEIIRKYASQYSWIHYYYREKIPGQSYYGSNVYAIAEGIKYAPMDKSDYLAILDADISLPRDYYEQILSRMQADGGFGVVSGVYVDNVNGKLRKVLNDRRSTPKALMVFRNACFHDIGGFIPMKYGGEDTVACFMARMKGWKTWSFTDLVAVHNKPAGTGHGKNMLQIRFRQGLCDWGFASHPLFMTLKALRRCVREYPVLVAGLARLSGFFYGYFLSEKRQIPDELVHFVRKEQLQRIVKFNKIKSINVLNPK